MVGKECRYDSVPTAPFAANEFPIGACGMMLAKINISPRSLSAIAFGIALLLNLVGACPSKAQVGAPNEQLTAAQVLDLQKRFQDATVACDAPTLEKLMADDVVFVHGNALVQNKAEFLEAARARRFRISSFEIANPKVVFFDGGAIVSGVEDIVLGPRSAGERPRKVQMRVSGVWVAKPGGWQLILQQSTPLQPLPSQPSTPSAPPR
jgi:ketosteroid isomerase-like protein